MSPSLSFLSFLSPFSFSKLFFKLFIFDQIGIRTGVSLLVLAVAIFYPDFESVMAFLGAFFRFLSFFFHFFLFFFFFFFLFSFLFIIFSFFLFSHPSKKTNSFTVSVLFPIACALKLFGDVSAPAHTPASSVQTTTDNVAYLPEKTSGSFLALSRSLLLSLALSFLFSFLFFSLSLTHRLLQKKSSNHQNSISHLSPKCSIKFFWAFLLCLL